MTSPQVTPDHMHIRKAAAADYPDIARIVSAVNPQHPVSAETLAHQVKVMLESPLKPHLQEWVALLGAEVVGQAVVYQTPGMFHPDRYQAEIMVLEQARRRGIGTQLARAVQAHLQARGAQEVLAGAYEDDPVSLRFLTKRGFSEAMRFFDNVLVLSEVNFDHWQEQMQLPAGVRAMSLAQLIGELGQERALRAFYDGYAEARLDVPRTGEATELTFESLIKRLSGQRFYPEGIWLAVTESHEVVALSELWRADNNPARLDVGLTGTRRAWRRRGLALALKLAAMQTARAEGAEELWTGNAVTNAPVLTLNQRLGFRPRPAYIEFKWGSAD